MVGILTVTSNLGNMARVTAYGVRSEIVETHSKHEVPRENDAQTEDAGTKYRQFPPDDSALSLMMGVVKVD